MKHHLLVVKTKQPTFTDEETKSAVEEPSDLVVFQLGRAYTSDVVVDQNTVSREQCAIGWDADKSTWWILDGRQKSELASEDSEEEEEQYNSKSDNNEERRRKGASSNGTWLCLTDYRVRYLRQHSE